MSKKRRRFIIIGVVVLLVIIVLLNMKRGEPAIKVSASVVKMDNIISEVRAEGILTALNQAQIGSDVMGRITDIRVKEGDKIRMGDTLCIIDQSTHIVRLRRAKASLTLAQAKLTKAEEDLRRTDELFKAQLISKEQYEREKLSYEMAKAEFQLAIESYNEAGENFNKTIITSPTDGEVLQINREEGEMVVMGRIGTPGSVIMTIADRSEMFVESLVDETEVMKIRAGQPALIMVSALPNTTFEGRVTRIAGIPETMGAGMTDAINFSVTVEIVEVDERLFPGMSATCEITVDSKDSVVIIPYPALGRKRIEGEERDVALVYREGKVDLTPIKLGLTGEDGAEIIDGLSVGDTILTGPHKILGKLEDGDRVQIDLKSERYQE